MKIGDREVKFAWTTGAFSDYHDWVLANQNLSGAHAQIYKAVVMHRAYLDTHPDTGVKPVTEKEVRALPFYIFKELMEEMKEAEARDSERTVEIAEEPKKKGKAAPQ